MGNLTAELIRGNEYYQLSGFLLFKKIEYCYPKTLSRINAVISRVGMRLQDDPIPPQYTVYTITPFIDKYPPL